MKKNVFMCGITGKIYFSKNKKVSREEIHQMNERIKHRGSDDEGIYINTNGNVGLGHRRLSIIDLSSAGHQPMSNEDGTIWIVFSGEIYNFQSLRNELITQGYKFHSNTDTEVIIHLYEEYGENCLKHLDGMFAFALWDEKKQKLFLARDRIGKKPLKYFLDKDFLIFASELKAILKILPQKPKVDFMAIRHFLSFNHVASPATGFEGIFKLPPAHYLLIHHEKIILKRYWDLDFTSKTTLSYQQAKEEALFLLEKAVVKRLVSDVPLGIFLSGGTDSAIITALMSKTIKSVKTFTVGFPQSRFDERRLARKVAEKFSTNHTELEIKPNAIEILPKLIYLYEEPYADSSALPIFYLSQLAKNFVTVALSGDGGDEAFGGYNRYLYWQWGHYFIKDFYNTIAQHYYFKKKWDKEPVLNNLDDVFALSFKTFLPNDLLVKVDIATMAHGLEVRSPFLDQQLLEFSAQLPWYWKIWGWKRKFILKDMFKNTLPAETLKGKRGFELPVNDWFRGDLYNWSREILLDRKTMQRGFFQATALERLLTEHKNGKNHGQRIWALLCLELWHRTFID